MILKNKKIAILGAGPVGLTMARLLQQEGCEVKVYERDKDPQARIWGGTLDLHVETGQIAMRKAGLLGRYFELGKAMGRVIVDEDKQVLFRVPVNTETPEINRNDLRTMLLESLLPGTVEWDRRFVELDGAWLHFEQGASVRADVVIGANGGLSGVRKYVTDTVVVETGSYILQGEVLSPMERCPDIFRLCDGNILMCAANGVTLAIHPDNNGAMTYGVTTGRPLKEEQLATLFPAFEALFSATGMLVALPARNFPLDKVWKGERAITLIGDAAHIMPPFAGQGVNTGMKDAMVLAENLTGGRFDSVEAAMRDYERQMFVYAGAAQQETRRNEEVMHREGFSFGRRFGQ